MTVKAKVTEEKKYKLNLAKYKTSVLQRIPSRKIVFKIWRELSRGSGTK